MSVFVAAADRAKSAVEDRVQKLKSKFNANFNALANNRKLKPHPHIWVADPDQLSQRPAE